MLGIAKDPKEPNSLLVVDAYHGIFHYNLDTKKVEKLVSADTPLEGSTGPRTAKIFNSIAVAQNGDFYWTSTSSNNTFDAGLYEFLSDPSGRLFHFDRKAKTNRLLADNLNFANGLALSPNEDFIVVAETSAGRVSKYNLKGANAGKLETLFDGLPGGPDNIQGDAEGYWLAIPLGFDAEHPFISHMLSNNPQARQFLTNLFRFTESPYGLLQDDFPENVKSAIKSFIGSFGQIGFALLPRTAMVRVDWNGNIQQTLYATDGSVSALSHGVPKDGYLYMGSPFNNYIAKYKL